MSTLNLNSLIRAYDDVGTPNAPVLQFVNWKRDQTVEVSKPGSLPMFVPPGATQVAFDGTRVTSLDGTTSFDLALSPLATDLYRLTFAAGTDPVLRTDRNLVLSGIALTLTVIANASLNVAAGAGTPFSAVQAGDEVVIAGTATGDPAGPFSILNQGRWTVLSVSGGGAGVVLARPTGEDWQGVSEAVTPTTNLQLIAYSSAGVQAGDKMKISAGFSSSAQRTFAVETVTANYIEFRSSLPLPAESGVVPGATGIQFFSAGKRYVRLEADQEAVVLVNGAVSGPQISPWTAGDPAFVGEYAQTGPVYSLSIKNLSTQTMKVLVITAE